MFSSGSSICSDDIPAIGKMWWFCRVRLCAATMVRKVFTYLLFLVMWLLMYVPMVGLVFDISINMCSNRNRSSYGISMEIACVDAGVVFLS